MNLKERYQHLKQWQEQPFDYEFATDERHRCCNCGHEFTGNYCPYCSQKAGDGTIGWDSVRRSVMDVWGLGSRSLPVTLLQLLLRPGCLISDYISGRRQVSFPPVKMLFIVSLIVVFWLYYLFPFLLGDDTLDVYGGTAEAFTGFTAWIKKYFVWSYFIMALLCVVPTWIMFRYAPRHTRHTLPQGFFIQVFLLVLDLMVAFLLLTPLIALNYSLYFYASTIAMMLFYVVAYRQLFGYGVWGTLWRVIFVYGTATLLISALVYILFDTDFSKLNLGADAPLPDDFRMFLVIGSALMGLLFMGIGYVANRIATRKARRQMAQSIPLE